MVINMSRDMVLAWDLKSFSRKFGRFFAAGILNKMQNILPKFFPFIFSSICVFQMKVTFYLFAGIGPSIEKLKLSLEVTV